jgi:chemotaxis protein CheD
MKRIPIIQGEHAVVSEPGQMITTLLGSCIAVCLQDPITRIGGMNHFLLGEPGTEESVSTFSMSRYGVHAMELLINAMMQRGAVRTRLRAHVYGGANIVAGLGSIGSSNAAFTRSFLDTEGIAIGHVDVGGTHARKVEFLAYDGKARSRPVAGPAPAATPRSTPLPLEGELELF